MSYHCAACAYRSPKWMGFCPQCRAPAALVEQSAASGVAPPRPIADVSAEPRHRLPTGIGEVDRVLGGGLVPGAVVLVGGEPGVGESTLVLQAAGRLAGNGKTVLVATAEESAEQVALRSSRLGTGHAGVYVLAERDVDAIVAAAGDLQPDAVVVDSIQAVASDAAGGPPGSVGQVRECAARLVTYAKSAGVPVIAIGHVTKDGAIAGPKLLEHVVDVVLSMEGDLDLGLRLLRGFKNRFGATHQVGLFEMGPQGLVEMADPSRAMLGDWRGAVSGTVVFPAIEGRRPLLVEVQALVSERSAPQPRRSVRGLDPARVHQILAVMERHAGLAFGGRDVYVGAVGGVRVRDPAVDLPVALALGSSLLDVPLGPVASWGEVGLTGEVRPVPHGRRRAEEAARLGLERTVAATGEHPGRIERALAEIGLVANGSAGSGVVLSHLDGDLPGGSRNEPAPLARARNGAA